MKVGVGAARVRSSVGDVTACSRAWPAEPTAGDLAVAQAEMTPSVAGQRWVPVAVEGPHQADSGSQVYWFRYRRL